MQRMFPKPEVWDEVEWCFTMISMGMDALAGKNGDFLQNEKREAFAAPETRRESTLKKRDSMRKEVACHLITSVPYLLRTILLVESN